MSSDWSSLAEALKGIDAAKLPHGLEQYKRFGPKTVRAILAVRDLVVHSPDLSNSAFRIGITEDEVAQEAAERHAGSLAFQTIFQSPVREEALIVEADVRLNFLWHFPGRCLNKADYRSKELRDGSELFVYVACFPETAFTILGKA